jgi:hypothetical protein
MGIYHKRSLWLLYEYEKFVFYVNSWGQVTIKAFGLQIVSDNHRRPPRHNYPFGFFTVFWRDRAVICIDDAWYRSEWFLGLSKRFPCL